MNYRWRRVFLVGMLVMLAAVAAAVPTGFLLDPSYGMNWAMMLGMSMGYGVICALAVYLPLEQRRARALAFTGLVLVVCYVVFQPWYVWRETLGLGRTFAGAGALGSDEWRRVLGQIAGTLAVAMGTCCFGALALLPRLRSWARLAGPLTLVCAMATLVLFIRMVWWTPAPYGVPTNVDRLLLMTGIVGTGAAGLTTFVLARFLHMKSPEQMTEVTTAVKLQCPRCLTEQEVAVGESRCRVCKLRFKLEVEEPRCPGCGYILRGLTRAVCPECGKTLGAEELAAATAASPQT